MAICPGILSWRANFLGHYPACRVIFGDKALKFFLKFLSADKTTIRVGSFFLLNCFLMSFQEKCKDDESDKIHWPLYDIFFPDQYN